MSNIFLFCGAIYGALGVAFGAFGAHALRARLSPERLAVWQTATEYQLLHALALIAVGLWLRQAGGATALHLAGSAFALGVLLFSGSLYLLVLSDQRWLGAVTPLGGVLMILGWAALAWAALRLR